jgi:voltage-dependent potassium channel beta subunit
MEYRFLGNSGLEVSELSFGAWVTFGNQVDNDGAKACMKAAYDAGVNFFDNAEGYAGGKAEIVMGDILKEMGWSRDTFVVSSKVFFGAGKSGPNQRGLGRKHVFEACHDAMKRLQVDYLDLYFCHRPDIKVPIEETVHAMTDLVRQGKVLHWGTSEWNAQQITEAHYIAARDRAIAPRMEQPQYNLFHRERVEKEYLPLFERFGMGSTIWSPLALGMLTGKYNDGIPPDSRLSREDMAWLRPRLESEEGQQKIEKVKLLGKLASDAGVLLPEVALLWCLRNPHVSTVITGASRVSQVEANMKALEKRDQLGAEFWDAVEKIADNKPVLDPSLR